MFRTINVALSALLILSACSAHKTVDSNSHQVTDDDMATMIVSVTQADRQDVPFVLYYRGIDESNKGKRGHFAVLRGKWLPLSREETSAKADGASGNVIVLTLPAGNYEFYALIIEDSFRQANWHSGGDYRIPFELTAGKASYVGNLHILTDEIGNNLLDIKSSSILSDKAGRDLTLFYQHFPNISESQVVSAVNRSGVTQVIERRHYGQEESGRTVVGFRQY